MGKKFNKKLWQINMMLTFNLLVNMPAMAQVPDEATKIKALKCAYHLNGNTFGLAPSGRPWAMIDLSGYDIDHCLPMVFPKLENDYLKRK